MAYKIAVGSSNEINVDLKFGEVKEFLIYEIEGRIKIKCGPSKKRVFK